MISEFRHDFIYIEYLQWRSGIIIYIPLLGRNHQIITIAENFDKTPTIQQPGCVSQKTNLRYAKLILSGPPCGSLTIIRHSSMQDCFLSRTKTAAVYKMTVLNIANLDIGGSYQSRARTILNIQEKLGLFVKLAKFKIRVFWFTYCQVVKVRNAESW